MKLSRASLEALPNASQMESSKLITLTPSERSRSRAWAFLALDCAKPSYVLQQPHSR